MPTNFYAANLQWVGIGTEASYGTPLAVPTSWLPASSPTWKPSTNPMTDQGLRGSMATDYQQVLGLRSDEVSFKTYGYLDSVFQIFRAALGIPDVISGTADPYLHKTSLQSGANGQPASTTVFWADAAGKVWQMPGSQVSSVKLSLKADGLAEIDVTYVGLPAIAIAPPTNTPTTAVPMPSWNSSITVAGVALTKYSEVSFEIKRASEMIPTITGSTSPFAIFAGPVSVSGSLNGVYQASTDTDLVGALTNVQAALVVKISPVGDTVHSITLQSSKVAYDDIAVSGSNKWMEIKATLKMLANPTDVAAGGSLSPLLVTVASPVATAL